MRLPLPIRDFNWVADIDNIYDGIPFSEVDLQVPHHINFHKKFSYFPLAPKSGEKLLATLKDKKSYILNYHTLLFYLKLDFFRLFGVSGVLFGFTIIITSFLRNCF